MHTHTRSGMWPQERKHAKRMHKRHTRECTHINSDGIILQKEGHSHALIYIHTQKLALGCGARKRETQANAEETHRRMHPHIN